MPLTCDDTARLRVMREEMLAAVPGRIAALKKEFADDKRKLVFYADQNGNIAIVVKDDNNNTIGTAHRLGCCGKWTAQKGSIMDKYIGTFETATAATNAISQ